jgi:ATP-binding cassette subfamily B protein
MRANNVQQSKTNALIEQSAWPLTQLDAALFALAEHSFSRLPKNIHMPAAPSHVEQLNSWLMRSAQLVNLVAQQVSIDYQQRHTLVAQTAPAIIRLSSLSSSALLVVMGRKGKQLLVLTPALKVVRISTKALSSYLVAPLEAQHRTSIQQLLDSAQVNSARREKAMQALLSERLQEQSLPGIWLLHVPPSESVVKQIKNKAILGKILALSSVFAGQILLFILGWWLISQAALSGHGFEGWLWAWGLLLLSQIPLSLLTTWLQANIIIDMGILIKKRLLSGSLQMQPQKLRHLGIGQLLSRVFDSEAIESVALESGFIGMLAIIELTIAASILTAGAAGSLHAIVLLVFILVIAFMCYRQFVLRNNMNELQLDMTHNLIEKMVGHRTRLAQQPPHQWHTQEDNELRDYISASAATDQSNAKLTGLMPRLWLLLSMAVLLPVVIDNQISSVALAISVGGILYAYQAIVKALHGINSITTALIAWRRMKPLFMQASQSYAPTSGNGLVTTTDANPALGPILTLDKVNFSYPNAQAPTLQHCDLSIYAGDRLLLQGHSGGGKSTLVNLITGIQPTQYGIMLYRGLDQKSLGLKQWRQHIISAPQFHDNHVFAGSFAFNLLIGDKWPPTHAGMQKAEQLCNELGLGPLLEKMPAGIMQMVGETGWQLSHGERSRLFIARALLQDAELVILDESFAALDPHNLHNALNCVRQHARTLLVIAHP